MHANRRDTLFRSLTILLVVLAGSVWLGLFSSQGPITIALEIFLLSAVGFSFIAVAHHEVVVFWRAVDFPWILTSFAAIVVSLVNISANERNRYVASAKSEIAKALSDVVYATRTIVTSDCETPAAGETRQSSPEPSAGACDRLKHDLPQLVRVSDQVAQSTTKIDVDGLRDWGRKLTFDPEPKLVGGWQAQAAAARTLVSTIDRYDVGLQTIASSAKDPIEDDILSTKLTLWYFIMAFFVGLRLSKTTAEVLQARSRAPR